jgi:glycine oxidase
LQHLDRSRVTATPRPTASLPDVIVVGAGLIGLACAEAAAREGLRVRIIGEDRPGTASEAAAGILAPSIEHGREVSAAAHSAAIAARDLYPSYVASLAERTGINVPLNRLGILELAQSDAEAERLHRAKPPSATWLNQRELSSFEPALGHALGAALHPDDGAVDNVILLAALRAAVASTRLIEVKAGRVRAVQLVGEMPAIITDDGTRHAARDLVLAAGAWVAELAGLPRVLPVEPLRGQMISYRLSPVRHVVYGASGYLVPRADGRILVGATMERVGFATGTTDEGIIEMERAGAAICPALAGTPRLAAWSGLRPVTPDLLPIIGRDPDHPHLLYACGHSRNGVLLAPLTGAAMAGLLTRHGSSVDLRPFSVDRFGRVGVGAARGRSPTTAVSGSGTQ